jgi:hypothetical protein
VRGEQRKNVKQVGAVIYAENISRNFVKPLFITLSWLQENLDEHGQGKWEGKQKGKSGKRITESNTRQKESTTLCTNLAD